MGRCVYYSQRYVPWFNVRSHVVLSILTMTTKRGCVSEHLTCEALLLVFTYVLVLLCACLPSGSLPSYKFGRKLTYINRLEELSPVLFLDQIDIPEEVKE